MSWRKKKKQIHSVKHKVKLVIGLMFAVVIGLIALLGYKLLRPKENFKLESRVENVKKLGKIKDSSYEAIGWIRIEGTDIDVPILYSTDKTKDFPVEVEKFVWTNNKSKEFTRQINISGHNIFNLSKQPKIKSNSFTRFEQLMAFMYYDFAKDNQYLQLTWGEDEYIYKIFYVGFVDMISANYINSYQDASDSDIKLEENVLKGSSFYDYDIDVNEKDKIITLTTCTRFYGTNSDYEFYVVGRMLRDNEKIEHYKVTKNSNYNDIEKILKGDDNNE